MNMRTTKYLIFAVLLLASCQKEAPGVGNLPMQVAPTLAGETKGSLTTADLADFYLQIVSDDAAYSYFEHASKDGSGAWTTSSKLFWKNETSPVSYCAARFGAFAFTADQFKNGVDLEVPADQRTQEQLNAADLLTLPAASKKYEDTTGGILPVTLSHGLAKVTFILTFGPKFYDNCFTWMTNPVKDFTISGTNACFTFDPLTGAVNVVADTKADITALPGAFTPGTSESKNATAAYEAILVPQTLASGALKVTFQVGSYYYEWSNADALTLVAGRTYDLAVSVTDAPPVDSYNGHTYVDMGNGLKWAACNVGADYPWDYGVYIAWGEIDPKKKYTWGNYKHADYGHSWMDITKYTFADDQTEGRWYSGGTFYGDGQTSLAADMYLYADDVARQDWRGTWRMPTDAEWAWLLDTNNCTSTWTTQSGVHGRLVTSKVNGNQLFLPAAGMQGDTGPSDVGSCGYYWSSSLSKSYSHLAQHVLVRSSDFILYNDCRYYGMSVRPVAD